MWPKRLTVVSISCTASLFTRPCIEHKAGGELMPSFVLLIWNGLDSAQDRPTYPWVARIAVCRLVAGSLRRPVRVVEA